MQGKKGYVDTLFGINLVKQKFFQPAAVVSGLFCSNSPILFRIGKIFLFFLMSFGCLFLNFRFLDSCLFAQKKLYILVIFADSVISQDKRMAK